MQRGPSYILRQPGKQHPVRWLGQMPEARRGLPKAWGLHRLPSHSSQEALLPRMREVCHHLIHSGQAQWAWKKGQRQGGQRSEGETAADPGLLLSGLCTAQLAEGA